MMENSKDWLRHRLQVVFDGTEEERHRFEADVQKLNAPLFGLIHTGKQMGVGGAKNFGADHLARSEPSLTSHCSDLRHNRLLMFSDNDMHYLPGWDERLEHAMETSPVTQLGGWKHPFHKVSQWLHPVGPDFDSLPVNEAIGNLGCVGAVDAVTGNCFVIRWRDWLRYGPFDANAIGPGQSEDFALSQKIKAGGGLVAVLDPPVAIHCGIINSEGKPAIGWREMLDMAMCQLTEHNLLDKVDLLVPSSVTAAPVRSAEPVMLKEAATESYGFVGLNVGSGQRRFDNAQGWINIDRVSRPPDQVPDVVLDASTGLVDRFGRNSADCVVLHHCLEHLGCGEGDNLVRQCWDTLKPRGSLLVFVPDVRKLAGRFLNGEIDEYTFMVNMYGAYQGEESDRHAWGFSREGLRDYLQRTIPGEGQVFDFDWREIPGADIAFDWWVLGLEAVKG